MSVAFTLVLGAVGTSASAAPLQRTRITTECSRGRVVFRTSARGKLYVYRDHKLIAHRHSHRVTVWSGGRRVTAYLKQWQHGKRVVRARKSSVCSRPAPTTASKPAPKPARKPSCIVGRLPVVAAHRGDSAHHVQSTRSAFVAAYDDGARVWETDVRFTSDGVPVLEHDATYDEFIGGSDLVPEQTTWAQAQTLRASDGSVVESLAAFAQLLAEYPGVIALPQIQSRTITAGQWAAYEAAVQPAKRQIVVASTWPDELVTAKADGYPTAQIVGRYWGAFTPGQIAGYGASVEYEYDMLTPALVARLHAAGVATVYGWTPQSAAQWAKLPTGVDPMVDDPAGYIKWFHSTHCA